MGSPHRTEREGHVRRQGSHARPAAPHRSRLAPPRRSYLGPGRQPETQRGRRSTAVGVPWAGAGGLRGFRSRSARHSTLNERGRATTDPRAPVMGAAARRWPRSPGSAPGGGCLCRHAYGQPEARHRAAPGRRCWPRDWGRSAPSSNDRRGVLVDRPPCSAGREGRSGHPVAFPSQA